MHHFLRTNSVSLLLQLTDLSLWKALAVEKGESLNGFCWVRYKSQWQFSPSGGHENEPALLSKSAASLIPLSLLRRLTTRFLQEIKTVSGPKFSEEVILRYR